VRGTRVVQIDARRKTIRDAAGIHEKFGVDPSLIPDLLAPVGDAADGYPGIAGIGPKTAAQRLNRYGQIENFPSNGLGKRRDLALRSSRISRPCASMRWTETSRASRYCQKGFEPLCLRARPRRNSLPRFSVSAMEQAQETKWYRTVWGSDSIDRAAVFGYGKDSVSLLQIKRISTNGTDPLDSESH